MTDPVPSKELFTDLSLLRASGFDDAADTIDGLVTALRGIQSCSTCEMCRGAANLALGGDRASVFSNPGTGAEPFVVTAGQVGQYTQPPSRYTVEPHGDGHALYFGRDHMHHGFNLARITEATPETLRLIEQALNAGAAPEPRTLLDMIENDRARREAAENLLASYQWQPIESAPVQMDPILMTDGKWFAAGHYDPCEGARKFRIYHFAVSQEYDWTPTHWMPLPAWPSQPPGDG